MPAVPRSTYRPQSDSGEEGATAVRIDLSDMNGGSLVVELITGAEWWNWMVAVAAVATAVVALVAHLRDRAESRRAAQRAELASVYSEAGAELADILYSMPGVNEACEIDSRDAAAQLARLTAVVGLLRMHGVREDVVQVVRQLAEDAKTITHDLRTVPQDRLLKFYRKAGDHLEAVRPMRH